MENKYKGKNISILGDSISTLEGYIPEGNRIYYEGEMAINTGVNSFENTWWGKLIKFLDANLLVNESYSGSMMANSHMINNYPPVHKMSRLSNLSKNGKNPDIIIIFIGTNDYYSSLKLYSEDKNDFDSYYNAYMYSIEKLKELYNNPEIWLLNLPKTIHKYDENYRYPEVIGGTRIIEFNEAIKKVAENYNLKLIDLYNTGKYNTIDGVHPDKKGMEDIFEMIKGNI